MSTELEEEFYETDRTRLLRQLPWLHMFRAFRMALDVRNLLLASVAVMLLAGGRQLIDLAPFAPSSTPDPTTADAKWPWEQPVIESSDDAARLSDVLSDPSGVLTEAVSHPAVVLSPVRAIVEPGSELFRFGNNWSDVAYAWTRLLWALAVWSLFGGAITRIAALQFAHAEDLGLRGALNFAGGRFLSAFTAPLLPLVFIGFFWIVCLSVGLIARIPAVGEVVASALWFVPLLCGLAITVIVLCIAAGWPLMVCTVSAQGTDAFDGLSRSYDYLLSRPWYALSLVLQAMIYGSVVLFFASAVVEMATHTAEWASASGAGEERILGLVGGASQIPVSDVGDSAAAETSLAGRTILVLWMQIVGVLLWGLVYSFFWSSATIIYFLLRKSVDATPLDEVYMPQPAGDGLPLVGVPAAEQREAESEDSADNEKATESSADGENSDEEPRPQGSG